MSERTVSQAISHTRLISTKAEATVFDAACTMTKAHCGSVLVQDNAGALIGIFTERDVLDKVVSKARNPRETSVAEVMTRNPVVIAPEVTVCDAVLIMKEKGFRHLPVVNPSGRVLGVFSLRDASAREIVDADDIAEYRDQVNDALA